MRVVFFGTPEFARDQFLFLLENNINIVGLVTQPDKRQGRNQRMLPCPVKKAYLDKSLKFPLFQPEKATSSEFIEEIKNLNVDLFIVVAYGKILRRRLLDCAALDCINVHGSLLPKYRGAAPIHRAIMAGEKKMGITIMKMVEALDAGDMLLKGEVSVDDEMDFSQIEKKLSVIAGPLLLEVIHQYEKGSVQGISQDEKLVTYAHKIEPEDQKLDFTQSARDIHNRIRALSPKPGAFCHLKYKGEFKRFKIIQSKVHDLEGKPYETIVYSKKQWILGCGKGSLELIKVQLEGKKAMDFRAFSQGLFEDPVIIPFD